MGARSLTRPRGCAAQAHGSMLTRGRVDEQTQPNSVDCMYCYCCRVLIENIGFERPLGGRERRRAGIPGLLLMYTGADGIFKHGGRSIEGTTHHGMNDRSKQYKDGTNKISWSDRSDEQKQRRTTDRTNSWNKRSFKSMGRTIEQIHETIHQTKGVTIDGKKGSTFHQNDQTNDQSKPETKISQAMERTIDQKHGTMHQTKEGTVDKTNRINNPSKPSKTNDQSKPGTKDQSHGCLLYTSPSPRD